MSQLSDTVYKKFFNDAKVIKYMAQSFDTYEKIEYAGELVNVELLATLLKFNHLVEFFKKISRKLADEYFEGKYALLNLHLDSEEQELIKDIFGDRNRISHMITEDVLINPFWETRAVFDMTKQLEKILLSYLYEIREIH